MVLAHLGQPIAIAVLALDCHAQIVAQQAHKVSDFALATHALIRRVGIDHLEQRWRAVASPLHRIWRPT